MKQRGEEISRERTQRSQRRNGKKMDGKKMKKGEQHVSWPVNLAD
jgi:hypothetical protein